MSRRVVLLFEKRFIEPIVSGVKTHTIRPIRKRPICLGDLLSLRHWSGKGYRSRQVTIKEAPCIGVQLFRLDDDGTITIGAGGPLKFIDAHQLALADGFRSLSEMVAWHKLNYGLGVERQIINWKKA